MKTVAFILKGYPRVSETFIAQEIFLLEQKGFQIEILAMRQARESQRQPVVERIRAPVTYIPEYIWPALPSVLWQSAKVFWRRPGRFVAAFTRALGRSVRQWEDDPLKRFFQAAWVVGHRRLAAADGGIQHLHSHFVHAPTEMTTYIAQLTGLPYSISAHAKDIYTIPEKSVVERVNGSRLIMTCTQFNFDFLRGLTGIDRGKVARVYHGVDLEAFQRRTPPAPDAAYAQGLKSLLSVGRLVPKKGYALILEALKELAAEGHDFHYDIYGDGELSKELAQSVRELGLASRVKFHGTTTHPQIIARLEQGGLFLSGSRQTEDLDRDGIPNTIAEAMAMEVPVIASRVSGIPELIVDGESGLLFAENDVAGLKRAILRAWSDPALTFRLGQGGRARVATVFNSRVWIEDCARLLREAMA